MKTIAKIRCDNLELLVQEFGTQEKVAELAGTSAVYLSQILHQALDSKTGKPRQMGDPTARKIEVGCKKVLGWMDNVHYAADHRQARILHAVMAMQQMGDWQLSQAIKILDTIAEPVPEPGNGTEP